MRRRAAPGKTMALARWSRLAVLIAVAGGIYFFFGRQPAKLTNKDTIVLADFSNTTGDSVFDGTLREGLAAQLEQSPFLNLVSDQRVAQTLTLMRQPKQARLTAEIAREVCQRTGSAATIEGSISNLGSQYVLGLKAVNCRTGELLSDEQVTASGKEQVLKALGDAATKLRQKIGESLASVKKYDAPLENVTTSSLEALQAYNLGIQTMNVANDYVAAIPFFNGPISLDPNFAMAYQRLATSYQPQGELTRAAEAMRKAYELESARAKAKNLPLPRSTRLSLPEISRPRAVLLSCGHERTRATTSRSSICGTSPPRPASTKRLLPRRTSPSISLPKARTTL